MELQHKSNILSNYRGNKNIPGIYQWIINRIPPFTEYFEIFAGSAAIACRLGFPEDTVINDISPKVTDALICRRHGFKKITCMPAVQLLPTLLDRKSETFVYCDPPYQLSTRGSNQRIYEYEMTDQDHMVFLSLVRTAHFNCMISHYECDLYNSELPTWNKESRKVRYRGKTVLETIYYNYPKPDVLQSYAYVGDDCWDRQRIKRKIDRLAKKLSELNTLEANAVINRSLKHRQIQL